MTITDTAPGKTSNNAISITTPLRALCALRWVAIAGQVAAVWVARSARNPDRLRLGTVPAAIGIPAAAGLAAALLPIRTGLARVGRGRVR